MNSPLTTLRQAGLVIRRKRRDDEGAWQETQSWLGGLPCIAPADWPRHPTTDEPLTHLAQINFAEFPEGPWSGLLPETGALCFFVRTYGLDMSEAIKAVYVPDPAQNPPCQPPADCPPIGGAEYWQREAWNRACTRLAEARRVMPQWPIDFVPVRCAERGDDESRPGVNYDPPLDTILGPPAGYVRTPPPDGRYHAPVCLPQEAPWEAARQIVVAIKNNAQFDRTCDLAPGLAAKLKDMAEGARRRRDLLRAFDERWAGVVAQSDPYAMMGADQAKAFEDDVSHLRQSDAITRRVSHAYLGLSDAGADVYRAMLLGPREMHDKVPAPIRDRFFNEMGHTDWRSDGAHQVFGIGLDLQGYLCDRDQHLLLFQANSDHMMDWVWGDLGIFQFFITPEDLAARNWDGVQCDFYVG